ncbi:MAG: hypothetical protein AAFV98_04210 [Chloroflexota bacterium]
MAKQKRYSDDNPRLKTCFACEQPKDKLFRIQYDASQKWAFVCGDCLWDYKRDDNPHYTYGGTWKSRK